MTHHGGEEKTQECTKTKENYKNTTKQKITYRDLSHIHINNNDLDQKNKIIIMTKKKKISTQSSRNVSMHIVHQTSAVQKNSWS